MRNYQIKKNNPYVLPHNLYMQILYIIKDYERLKIETKHVFYSLSCKNNVSEIMRLNFNQKYLTLKLNALNKYILAIYEAKKYFEETHLDLYENGFNAIKAFHSYEYFSIMTAKENRDECPSKISWARYRSKFAFVVASHLNLA